MRKESKEVAELRKAVDHYFKNQKDFARRLEVDILKDEMKRSKAALKWQEKLFKKAFESSGISISDIGKRQEKDSIAAKEFAARKLKALKKNSKSKARRLKSRTLRLSRLGKKFENLKGNPGLAFFLCYADLIDDEAHTAGDGDYLIKDVHKTYGANASENIAKTKLKASSGKFNWIQLRQEVKYFFIWNCDRNGILQPSAIVNFNGEYDIHTPSACIAETRARACIQAEFFVAQNNGVINPTVITDPAFLLDKSCGKSCAAKVDIAPIVDREEITLTPSTPLPVVADKPVMCGVNLDLYVFAAHGGEAMLDLQDHGVNVPCITLSVEEV